MPNIIRHVIVEEGFFSLWKGNSAMILRIAPYAAIQFMTYEQMKAWFVRFELYLSFIFLNFIHHNS